MKYSKSRAYEQILASSLKSKKLEAGVELKVIDVIEGSITQNGRELANDTLLVVKNDGTRLRVPMRELVRMRTEENKDSFTAGNGDDLNIPDNFKIVSSSDRKDRLGRLIYPVQAYTLGQQLLDGKITVWDDVVKGGVKADNQLDPVQDYVIAII